MKKLEITYRNLGCVPNEIILGIYNGLYPNEPIVSALDLTDPQKAKLFIIKIIRKNNIFFIFYPFLKVLND